MVKIHEKVLGLIQFAGGILAGVLGWLNKDWAVVILAVVILIMGVHHLTEKKKHK
ncbi:MAG: hypothetical protein KJ597_00530 [Nanoarchaeota archaeon]|nr:hypothetical protein [Nanoarchaeota archaeon]MBU1622038.1 hypothetical protein [Nanoarchaeota archaeon]